GPPGSGPSYSNANGSIAGNGPHNPFLAESATFTLNVPGVTSASSISAVKFQFGTTDGSNQVTGEDPPDPVPEPTGLTLAGIGLAMAGGWLGLRRRAWRAVT